MELLKITAELKKMTATLTESTTVSLTKLFSKTKFKKWKVLAYKKKQVFFQHENGYVFRVDSDVVGGDTMYSLHLEWPIDVKISDIDSNFHIKDVAGKKHSVSEMLDEKELMEKLPVLNKIIKKFAEKAQ